jgi:hypothetical protein
VSSQRRTFQVFGKNIFKRKNKKGKKKKESVFIQVGDGVSSRFLKKNFTIKKSLSKIIFQNPKGLTLMKQFARAA